MLRQLSPDWRELAGGEARAAIVVIIIADKSLPCESCDTHILFLNYAIMIDRKVDIICHGGFLALVISERWLPLNQRMVGGG